MVSCKQCLTPNSLDSTFCKRCGAALPEDEILAAKDKLNDLIAQGNTLFNEGRTEEAMAIAESALLSYPTSTSALSLKLLVHERRGELADALECADQIVDLNPDSDLDKIRRNHLRTKLATTVQLATQPPDRRSALIGAVAAMVLVVCVGVGLAKVINRGDSNKGTQVAVKESPQQPINPTIVNNNPVQAPNTGGQTGNPNGGQQQNRTSNQVAPIGDGREPALGQFNTGNGGLPSPGSDDGTTVLVPDSVVGPIGGGNKQPAAPKQDNVAHPTPTPTNHAGGDPGPVDPNPAPVANDGKPADPGHIDIQLSSGQPRRNPLTSGSTDIGSGGVEALVHTGMQQLQLERYAPAASTFEQALRAGGDQMSLNQRLALCYSHLDRKSEAVNAYKKSIAACQQALSSGGGNKDAIQSRLDSCQQALKALQGN